MSAVHPLLELTSDAWRVRLAPSLGGSVVDARWRGHDVLRPTTDEHLAAALVRKTACYPLVPFSNRVGFARFEFDGEAYTLHTNFPDEPHSIHGVGFQREWAVESHSDTALALRLSHTPDSSWPFAFEARQRFCIEGDTLVLTMSLTNLDARRAPAGLGWHPFFPLQTALGNTRLVTHWDAMLVSGPDRLPCESVAPPAPRPLDDTVIDNCFTGWSRAASIDSPHHRIAIDASEALRCAVLFRPEGQPFYAFEPVSHPNNALNGVEPAMHVLEAGATLDARMRLTLSPPTPESARTQS
ncbi:aldose 1-epimerase [Paraburkholderia antibiotica]|uniref:Aldose 1-epimerase n=1 Tax=Paraburkholderia antibiotica TaxID=2728839 RepID=A0A7Y0A1X1_9BURK|nr:aldose 1-epimerase [Paraburkholderia antibiotica]NML34986.1 aldose 1-epimerase [Paraburkholderia antibiotica]